MHPSPSTISSESSTKNSLSGGLFGRLSVFNSCWIFVDTLLLTGTPEQTRGAATVTDTCKHWIHRRTCTSNTKHYLRTHAPAHRQDWNQQEKIQLDSWTQIDNI